MSFQAHVYILYSFLFPTPDLTDLALAATNLSSSFFEKIVMKEKTVYKELLPIFPLHFSCSSTLIPALLSFLSLSFRCQFKS